MLLPPDLRLPLDPHDETEFISKAYALSFHTACPVMLPYYPYRVYSHVLYSQCPSIHLIDGNFRVLLVCPTCIML